MRRQFAKILCERAQRDPTLVLLVGDIGYGVFEEFSSSFPDRYFNVGIAEQNSIGLMSGLSKEGYFPVFFTIIPFLLYRPFEFIRNDLLINERSGLLVGVGAGLSYGALGPTHHAVEDLAVCSALPGLFVYSPSTVKSMQVSSNYILEQKRGLSYLRLGKREEFESTMDRYNVLNLVRSTHHADSVSNSKVLIISYGDTAIGAIHSLSDFVKSGVVCMVSLDRIQPLPEKELLAYANTASCILIIEEQLNGSGIYRLICELLFRNKLDKKLVLVNLKQDYVKKVGSSVELQEEMSLSGTVLRELVEGLI